MATEYRCISGVTIMSSEYEGIQTLRLPVSGKRVEVGATGDGVDLAWRDLELRDNAAMLGERRSGWRVVPHRPIAGMYLSSREFAGAYGCVPIADRLTYVGFQRRRSAAWLEADTIISSAGIWFGEVSEAQVVAVRLDLESGRSHVLRSTRPRYRGLDYIGSFLAPNRPESRPF